MVSHCQIISPRWRFPQQSIQSWLRGLSPKFRMWKKQLPVYVSNMIDCIQNWTKIWNSNWDNLMTDPRDLRSALPLLFSTIPTLSFTSANEGGFFLASKLWFKVVILALQVLHHVHRCWEVTNQCFILIDDFIFCSVYLFAMKDHTNREHNYVLQ
jgi:hypothetical protein